MQEVEVGVNFVCSSVTCRKGARCIDLPELLISLSGHRASSHFSPIHIPVSTAAELSSQ
jgi:hypothetical protein